jgi:hypothetical protein
MHIGGLYWGMHLSQCWSTHESEEDVNLWGTAARTSRAVMLTTGSWSGSFSTLGALRRLRL